MSTSHAACCSTGSLSPATRPGWQRFLLPCLLTLLTLPGAATCTAADEAEPAGKEDDYATRIYIADSDGSNRRPLVHIEGYSAQGSPDWSQNGKLAGFDTWRERAGESGSDAVIAVVNADGSNPRILGDGAMPSFSPEGHRIAFSRYRDRGVWVMSSEGPDKELVLLDERGWGTDWSPDGTRIAWTTYAGGGANLVVYNLVEGTRELLFDAGGSPYRQIYWNFAWSGDSRSIVFKAMRSDKQTEVAMVDARGASYGLTTLLKDNPLPALAWSPDAKQILISLRSPDRQNHQQLFSLKPEAGTELTLLPGLDPKVEYLDAAFSPDGKQLLFSGR